MKLIDMKGKFFNVEYIPNKLVYVYEITKDEILFLAFFNECGNGMRAIKHQINKKSKTDFKELKNYNPISPVLKMIETELNS